MKHLQEKKEEIIPELKEEFDFDNENAAPSIEKVVVNTSFGKKLSENPENKPEIKEEIFNNLALITGQKPVATKARQSISAFDVTEGEVIGAKTTLRGNRMYDFLERVIHVALPRSKDFRGINPESIDEHGNLTFSFDEQVAFPEVEAEETDQIFGLEVTVVTDSNREQALRLFELLDFPFKEK
ncbi:MAG: 50S ribosomal protein L5 [Candidatus Paceibacterota bacterium]